MCLGTRAVQKLRKTLDVCNISKARSLHDLNSVDQDVKLQAINEPNNEKPVFRVCDQVRLKLAEVLDLEILGIIQYSFHEISAVLHEYFIFSMQQILQICGDHAGIFVQVAGIFLEKLEDGHA